MPTEQLLLIFITALVTGGISSLVTVGALKVHIVYLREGLTRNENSINRAHDRITDIEKA